MGRREITARAGVPERPALSVVVPCYNEAEVLPETIRRLRAILADLIARKRVSIESRIIFVDDGSKDATWRLIAEAAEAEDAVCGIKLSRNRGHQIALIAGLMTCPGDVVVSVDADLQDDLGAIDQMLDSFEGGAEIVYGVRRSRTKDTMFKRMTAEGYYRFLDRMGVDVVFNHADYRLMSRRAVEALRQYGEANLFVRGIIPQLGYHTATVQYDRHERLAGESKYPVGKMISLALDGLTSFSTRPLRLITWTGIIIAIGALFVMLWALVLKISGIDTVPGWTSIVVPMLFLGAIQLVGLGVIGEYVGRIYLETKRRPRYHVEEIAGLFDFRTDDAAETPRREPTTLPTSSQVH